MPPKGRKKKPKECKLGKSAYGSQLLLTVLRQNHSGTAQMQLIQTFLVSPTFVDFS
jgi:hypothetical protein